VCVECIIGKQKKPILFKVTEPSKGLGRHTLAFTCIQRERQREMERERGREREIERNY